MEPPEGAAHILGWFLDLSERRAQGYSGPNPISFAEISAWCALTGERPSREEVAIILKMDAAFLKAVAEERDEQMARQKEKANNGGRGNARPQRR
ncbi:phage tail assembly chaperone [Xanthobacter tagetidis]|uniref:phage tail assembly chaperone n=1 Tax=Xanthobacter tagetidis TaxID=60216 RepID=UPI003CCD4648